MVLRHRGGLLVRMGMWELVLIFAVLLLLFGATRLPQLGSSLGSAIRNFKRGFTADEPAAGDDAKGQATLAGTTRVPDAQERERAKKDA